MSWKKLSHVEHILRRPDSYVGSLIRETSEQWVGSPPFKSQQVKVSPGLVKIFDEVLVNAVDQHSINPKKTTRIDVTFQKDIFSVRNNGEGIPLSVHAETGVRLPELIFGHLLTSSNYDDEEQRTTGGRNGYGAKLTNVYSNKFTVRVLNSTQKYTQRWSKNMSVCEPAEIVTASKGGYVDIEFQPDWSRFEGGIDQLPQLIQVLTKRVWDAAACCPKCHVYLNGNRLEVKTLEDYAKMHFGDIPFVNLGNDIVVGHSSTGSFQQLSFVNGISTTHGGTHVERFVSQLVPKLAAGVRPAQIKASLFVMMRCTIVNPTFSSQTKTECTSKLDTVYDFKPKFIKDVLATGIGDDLIALAVAKTEKELKKTDGSKKNRITGIPKLDDANWAGTHKSHECTLIVTEGDSAKTLAVAGLSVVGRNAYGVFPLRGKPRNVRDASVKQLTENEEFSSLKKILGLQHGRVYTSLRDLRYGRLMIMTDADLDGSHIKGLVLNMIHHFWPSLIELGFVVAMVTPVIKVGKEWYFTEEAYRSSGNNSTNIKYYKGLGTSTSSEAKEYFKMIDRLTVEFKPDTRTNESMILAFSKAMSDARKVWLVKHMATVPPGVEYGKVKHLSVSDFVHKDLANFSVEDIKRSIPHIADGLKPSQRKVIFACLKRNLTKDAKVAQLCGYIAEQTMYHHGEASLQGTIIGLAQNFTGSNNVNLLEPSGQFGTRLMGGKDAASPRYIFTRLTEKTRRIFDQRDESVLKYVLEDGHQVEPMFYVPIVPMVLINGAEGIGTGFSSYVPPYDPSVITKNIQNALHGQPMEPMVPYFKGFTGKIEKTAEHTWSMTGTFERQGGRIHITELPPGKWIQDYKEFLDGLDVRYENHSTETKAEFYVWTELNDPKALGLVKSVHTSNMYLIGPDGAVKKYTSPEEILVEYLEMRIELYKKRKSYLIKEYKKHILEETTRANFIREVASGRLVVFQRSRSDIEEDMKRLNFPVELLVSVRTYQYTADEIAKAVASIKKLQEELATLESTTVSNLWKQDLASL
jgi:DNA topoisomerase-2